MISAHRTYCLRYALIAIYMIMSEEPGKTAPVPSSFCSFAVYSAMYDKCALIFHEIEKNDERDRLLYRSLLPLVVPQLLPRLSPSSSFPLPLYSNLLLCARRCLLISRANPASNFGRPTKADRVLFLSENDRRGSQLEVKQILSITNRETNFWPFRGDQSVVLDVCTRSIRFCDSS